MGDRDWKPSVPLPTTGSGPSQTVNNSNDFVPSGVIWNEPDGPSKAQKVMHIKIVCPNCGVLLAHYKVTNPGVYLTLEAESCSECAIGMVMNQQIEHVTEENSIDRKYGHAPEGIW